ncbi:MAG: hypothetical protein OXP36_08855, partial [Gammaproteobacteria bacterium]|nr:hypothetical protein [Gammaproteobacteria bacterium]
MHVVPTSPRRESGRPRALTGAIGSPLRAYAIVGFAVLLTACGGGSGGGSAPPLVEPPTTPPPAPPPPDDTTLFVDGTDASGIDFTVGYEEPMRNHEVPYILP